MELLTFNIAQNETKRFERAGRYFEIIDALRALTVEFTGPNGEQGDDMRNALSGFYYEGNYSGFEISSVTAQSITVMVSDGRGGSRRQPGNVRVIDQSTDKTAIGGLQFYESNASAANAGAVSVVSIFGNGRTISIQSLLISSTTAGIVGVGYFQNTGTSTPIATSMSNKLAYGSASQARLGASTTAAQTPTPGEVPSFTRFLSVNVAANIPLKIDFKTPIVLGSDKGLLITGNVVNRDIACAFETEES